MFRSAHAACASGITHERCAYLRHRKKTRKKTRKRANLKLRLAYGRRNKKNIGECNRYFSQAVFFHEDQTKRKWLSYSLSKDCLFCLPCLLFSDECLRGENVRHNQGNAFTKAGYSNWKKQYSNIAKHAKNPKII